MPMKRVWGFVLGSAALISGAGATASGCAHDDSTIFVRQVLAPQLLSAGQVCAYTSDPSQPFLSSGTLDVLIRRPAPEYDAVFLVANQLVPRGDPNGPTTETSYVELEGAEVRVLDSMGAQLNTFTRLASATIPPSQGANPSYTPIGPVTIVDQGTASSLQLGFGAIKRLVVFVKFFGKTLGGQYVESNDFEFPVDVCQGCLIGFAPSDISPTCASPNCLGNPTMTSQVPPAPCVIGQDDVVDCQYCKAFGVQACNPVVGCLQDAGGGG
jgi:hypothetical protein